MSSGPGCLINLLRVSAFLDDRFDRPVTDLDFHTVHGGSIRKREDVHGLDLFLVWIAEDLGELDLGDVSRHLGADVGMLQWKLKYRAVGIGAP